MAKHKNDYFELMEEQAGFCLVGATLLEETLTNFSVESIAEQKKKMHDNEHLGDQLQHDILTRLSSEFITPIDQEDILRLVQIIDDVTDSLDEVVLEFYMYHIQELPAHAWDISIIVHRCICALYETVRELKNFKKPAKLRDLLVEVNNIESEADAVFQKAINSLFERECESKMLISHKAIYESLENCCDLCEHAADVIEQIVIKNT